MIKGKAFEIEFDSSANFYHVLSIPQYVQSGFNKDGKLFMMGGAYPDRVCAIRGYMFVLDLKATNNKNKVDISLGFRGRAAIRKCQQFEKLKKCDEFGIVSFYLVHWTKTKAITMHFVNKESEWPFFCYLDEGYQLPYDKWFSPMCSKVLSLYGEEGYRGKRQ